MPSLDRPRLRPLRPYRVDRNGESFVAFEDSLGVADANLAVPLDWLRPVLARFDGGSTASSILDDLRRDHDPDVTPAWLDDLIARLDAAMVLDGPTYERFKRDYREAHTRPAALAGRSYAGSARALRAQLAGFFHREHGGSPVGAGPGDGSLRAILSPHIDFGRGGHVYTWPYKELIEHSDADTFVILGVAHQYCEHRFALTYKDFETPLGLARTDRSFVEKLAALGGEHLFDDEIAHRTEHSIEFQVVFLQYLLGDHRDYSIVPILVGSFHDLMSGAADPMADPDVRRFVDALRAAEAAHPGKVAYIGGIDLGHIGRQFGDRELLEPRVLDELREFDQAMLAGAVAGDAESWFRTAAAVDNRWRICGLAATYVMLQALGPSTRGRLLKYDQAVDPARTCCVSLAGVAFHQSEPRSRP